MDRHPSHTCSTPRLGIFLPVLIGIGTFDVLALVAAPLLLLFVAGAAAYFPARRAALVDPAVALRSD